MSKKPIQRKEVHLDTETIVALTGQAIMAGKSLKPYMENVLMAQATLKSYLVAFTNVAGIDECHVFRAEDGEALKKATALYNELIENDLCSWAVLSTIIHSTDY